ncbi:hypothetical protein V6N11_009282 [Hibiscus sabdariffa]
MSIGLELVDVPIIATEVLPVRKVGGNEDQPNIAYLGGHSMSDTSFRSISNESRLQEIQVEEGEVMAHAVVPRKVQSYLPERAAHLGSRMLALRIGATPDGFNRVHSNSLVSPNLNPSSHDVNRAEAIATREVREKLGVTFDILDDQVVKRFQEIVEKEACS